MNGSKISPKKIDSHLSEISEEKQLLDLRIQQLQEEKERKQKIEDKLKRKKKKLESKHPDVSEHGVIRFLERVEGRDIQAIKGYILHPSILDMMKTLGKSGTYPHPDGFSVIFKNNFVVTVTK
jgi:hypothetical protein